MKSTSRGKRTSPVEVTNVSANGLWLLLNEKEHFLPFEQFPWFPDASIAQVTHVELPNAHHLHWPDLDVDLAVESLGHPERYSLVNHATQNTPVKKRGKSAATKPRGAH
jgi:hypothetical protein